MLSQGTETPAGRPPQMRQLGGDCAGPQPSRGDAPLQAPALGQERPAKPHCSLTTLPPPGGGAKAQATQLQQRSEARRPPPRHMPGWQPQAETAEALAAWSQLESFLRTAPRAEPQGIDASSGGCNSRSLGLQPSVYLRPLDDCAWQHGASAPHPGMEGRAAPER